MKILIVNSAEEGISEFTYPIQKIFRKIDVDSDIVEYKSCLHVSFNDYDGVVISGSPQGDDIVEHHQPWFQWLKSYKKPVLGICAGHHVLGYMYGSEYLRSVEPESGIVEIEILRSDPIFNGLPTKLKANQMHNDSITLPENFIHLAKSEVCFNQVMKHPDKPHYTFQFHPEFVNHEIFLNFKRILEDFSKL